MEVKLNNSAAQKEYDYMKNLNPTFRYDGKEDFSSWQKRARAKLKELLCIDKIEESNLDVNIEFEKEHEDFKEIRFTFQSEKDYRVPCHLLVPKNADKPLPAVICLQGHSKGMHISLARVKYEGDEKSFKEGDRDFAIRIVKEGYCALAIEQRGFGECGGDETGPKCHIPAMSALINGRTMIGQRVWDISKAIDVLETSFGKYADKDKIMCMGNSGGGTATIYASCIDERIKLAMPSCAFASYSESIGAMKHCVCNFIPNIAENFDMADLGGLIAPRYLVVVSGKTDKIFPLDSAREMFDIVKSNYKSAGCEENCAMVEGDGGHRFYADDAWPVANKYIEKM